jgi:hypothetical protein
MSGTNFTGIEQPETELTRTGMGTANRQKLRHESVTCLAPLPCYYPHSFVPIENFTGDPTHGMLSRSGHY